MIAFLTFDPLILWLYNINSDDNNIEYLTDIDLSQSQPVQYEYH